MLCPNSHEECDSMGCRHGGCQGSSSGTRHASAAALRGLLKRAEAVIGHEHRILLGDIKAALSGRGRP